MFFRVLFAAVLIVVGAVTARDGWGRDFTIYASPVPLNAHDPDQKSVGSLIYRGGLVLTSPDPAFGGWSDLVVSRDGKRITAISDRAAWFDADLKLDATGAPIALENARIAIMPRFSGQSLQQAAVVDAEGLTREPDGSFLVSFERAHRIWRYPAANPPFSLPPVSLPSPTRLKAAPLNGGIEALLRLSSGGLIALTEDLKDEELTVGWVGDGKTWEELHYRAGDTFKPTSMAEIPSGLPGAGDVLVLERHFSIFEGLAVRIVRVPRGSFRPNVVVQGSEIAHLRQPMSVDNFEGIAVVPQPNGIARIYLLSDDNFSFLQQTLLLAFDLLPVPAKN